MKLPRRAPVLALVLVVAAFAGCIGAGEETDVAPASPASNGSGEESATFEPRNHTLAVDYYARAAGIDSQNMDETNWELPVPADASEVRARAEWTPSTPLARDQAVMVHVGSADDPGEMLAGAGGASPQQTGWIELPGELETITIMCHVYTNPPHQPVGLELEQETDLVVEFR